MDDSYDRVLEAIDAYRGSNAAIELRWRPFSAEELKELWAGLVYDDGIRYGQEPDSVEERLVRELEAELTRRGSWG